MKYCQNCGKKIDEDSKYCSECGARIEKETIDPEIIDDEYSSEDIEQTKVLSLFAYINFLFIIPLIACKDSKYARFHVNQGIILCITSVILSVAINVAEMFSISYVYDILEAISSIGMTVLMIIGIVNATTGKAKRLPIIGKFDIFVCVCDKIVHV